MVNNMLNINASYNGQHCIFKCVQSDFLKQAAEKFKIDDIRNVEMYSVKDGKKQRIHHFHIEDLMQVHLEDKRKKNGQQQTIDSYAVPKEYENIILKLRSNTTLSGPERREIIVLIQSHFINSSNKRKIDDVTPDSECKISHKKVQVNMPLYNCKVSETQTDEIALSTSLQKGVIAQDNIADRLKKLSSKPDADRLEVEKLMEATYDDRRVYIKLKYPPVSTIREKYPFLFRLEEVKNELGRIFHSGKPQEFIDNMYKYAPFIVQMCKSKDLALRTKKAIDRSQTNVQKKYAEVVGSVFILTDLMEEQWRFIHLMDYPSGSEDIYPHIDISCQSFKDLFYDRLLYNVKVEGYPLCEASNFMEAVLCLVAAFFIFNIDYPESCRRTMIMFEKLYLEANDTVDIDDHTNQMVKLLHYKGNNSEKKKKKDQQNLINILYIFHAYSTERKFYLSINSHFALRLLYSV